MCDCDDMLIVTLPQLYVRAADDRALWVENESVSGDAWCCGVSCHVRPFPLTFLPFSLSTEVDYRNTRN